MRYEPNRQSIQQHQVPEWYHDAKFGIFIHWGPFSIPAYAPLGHGDIQELLANEGYRSLCPSDIPQPHAFVEAFGYELAAVTEHEALTGQ